MAHFNSPDDGLRELALFAGAGGGILGGKLLGWRTICAVEWEPYPAAVLARRQDEGFLPPFPIWDDVQTFDGKPWRGLVDVVSGGFPCQDISIAGKGDGLDGERSGMWKHMARIIGEIRPRYALVENSPMLTSRGLDRVLGDLAEIGYDAEWVVLGADDTGAPHRRKRIWILAYAQHMQGEQRCNPSVQRGWPAETEQAGMGSSRQYPIGQLADTDMLGCVHGQAEEQPTEGRVHAQREPEPGGVEMEDAHRFNGECGPREGYGVCSKEGREGSNNHTCRRGEDVRGWWSTEPNVGRVAHGVASRVDELKALGNGQVASVVRLAWHTLHERLMNR